uniref:Transposase Tnp1/En/Spm-like domain-containing protein n=1 Tax=Ananas comosus var. bracteatus TaxID=296719 RepID=A0A6V7NH78_ANACO|nr:unnamed protein product [Ananas comosus var. bracteatus]
MGDPLGSWASHEDWHIVIGTKSRDYFDMSRKGDDDEVEMYYPTGLDDNLNANSTTSNDCDIVNWIRRDVPGTTINSPLVVNVANSTRKSKNKRGPTRMLKIWATRDDKLLPQKFNEFDQPIGDDATKFTNFLGTVVRNGNDAPLIYKDWRQVPSEYKEKLWNLVKLKYDIEDDSMSWVIKALRKKWKDFKCELKKKHYDAHKTYEERVADRDPRVIPDQWKHLVDFWNSEEGQSDIDKITMDNPEKAKKALKEGDLFLEVFGKERHGHVRGLGLGPCPTDIWSSMPSRATSVRMAYEAKRKAEEETRGMQEKMAAMEQEQIELKAKLAKMEAKMDAWQRSPNDFHQSNSIETRVQNVANVNEDAANGLERDAWSSSSSSTHAIPTHRIGSPSPKIQLGELEMLPNSPRAVGLLVPQVLKPGHASMKGMAKTVTGRAVSEQRAQLEWFSMAHDAGSGWPTRVLPVPCLPAFGSGINKNC